MANAKERERMKLVSEAFDKLSSVVPVSKMLSTENDGENIENNSKNPVTKVSTLRCAIAYINSLEKLIEDANTGSIDPALYALNDQESEPELIEHPVVTKKSKKLKKKGGKKENKNVNKNKLKQKNRQNLKLRQYHASDFKKKNSNFVAKPMSKAQLNLAIAKGLQNCKPIYNPPPPTKKPPILNFPPNSQPLQLIQLRPLNTEVEMVEVDSEFLQGPNLEVFLQQTPSPTNSSMMASSPGSSSGSSNNECFTTILEEPHILDDIQAVLMDADNFDILV